jgi:putative SOS response-associated peptidase YedK
MDRAEERSTAAPLHTRRWSTDGACRPEGSMADKAETKETFTIVTTEPSNFAAQFHNRMPLVLEPNT